MALYHVHGLIRHTDDHFGAVTVTDGHRSATFSAMELLSRSLFSILKEGVERNVLEPNIEEMLTDMWRAWLADQGQVRDNCVEVSFE